VGQKFLSAFDNTGILPVLFLWVMAVNRDPWQPRRLL